MTTANKAVVAFLLAFIGSILGQIQGRKEFSDLTTLEWVIVVLTAVVVAGGVYVVPNRPAS